MVFGTFAVYSDFYESGKFNYPRQSRAREKGNNIHEGILRSAFRKRLRVDAVCKRKGIVSFEETRWLIHLKINSRG